MICKIQIKTKFKIKSLGVKFLKRIDKTLKMEALRWQDHNLDDKLFKSHFPRNMSVWFDFEMLSIINKICS